MNFGHLRSQILGFSLIDLKLYVKQIAEVGMMMMMNGTKWLQIHAKWPWKGNLGRGLALGNL